LQNYFAYEFGIISVNSLESCLTYHPTAIFDRLLLELSISLLPKALLDKIAELWWEPNLGR